MKKATLSGEKYLVNPIEIEKGKIYKNFKGYYREVLDILETADGRRKKRI